MNAVAAEFNPFMPDITLPHPVRDPEDVKVLVACETSGRVRNELLTLGFDCFSCDVLPSEDGSNRHYTDDVRYVLQEETWDMMIVAHPPCKRLCASGVRWLHEPPEGRTLEEMWAELDEGCDLYNTVWQADVKHVAVENPVIHKHARERIIGWAKPQYVQPYWFGDPWTKKTGFMKRNLPDLEPTDRLTVPDKGTDQWKQWQQIHYASPGPERWKFRSRTPEGLARAMAEQWGHHVLCTP